jgi:hypothetical protein
MSKQMPEECPEELTQAILEFWKTARGRNSCVTTSTRCRCSREAVQFEKLDMEELFIQ